MGFFRRLMNKKEKVESDDSLITEEKIKNLRIEEKANNKLKKREEKERKIALKTEQVRKDVDLEIKKKELRETKQEFKQLKKENNPIYRIASKVKASVQDLKPVSSSNYSRSVARTGKLRPTRQESTSMFSILGTGMFNDTQKSSNFYEIGRGKQRKKGKENPFSMGGGRNIFQ